MSTAPLTGLLASGGLVMLLGSGPTLLAVGLAAELHGTRWVAGSAHPSSLPGQYRSMPVSPIATTRGFAGILREGLDGLPAAELLAVPDDISDRLGLARAVSPLRLRGMAGMLGRIKRQVRERTA